MSVHNTPFAVPTAEPADTTKQRGVRLDDPTWAAVQRLAKRNRRTAAQEAKVAIETHLRANGEAL